MRSSASARPCGAGEGIVLAVGPGPETPALTEAEDVLPTEGVVEEAGVVATLGGGLWLAPVDAIGGRADLPALAAGPAEVEEHLEALIGIRGVTVEPDDTTIAAISRPRPDDGVRPLEDVEGGTLPDQPVATRGQGCGVHPAGVVPELEALVSRIVPQSVV